MAVPLRLSRLEKLHFSWPSYNAVTLVIAVGALLASCITVYLQFLRVDHNLTASVLAWQYDPVGDKAVLTVAFLNRGNQQEVVVASAVGLVTEKAKPPDPQYFEDSDWPYLETLPVEDASVLEAGHVLVRRLELPHLSKGVLSDEDRRTQGVTLSPNLILECAFINAHGALTIKSRRVGLASYSTGVSKTVFLSGSEKHQIHLLK